MGNGDSLVSAASELWSDVRGAGRLPANPQLPRPARQAIGRRYTSQ